DRRSVGKCRLIGERFELREQRLGTRDEVTVREAAEVTDRLRCTRRARLFERSGEGLSGRDEPLPLGAACLHDLDALVDGRELLAGPALDGRRRAELRDEFVEVLLDAQLVDRMPSREETVLQGAAAARAVPFALRLHVRVTVRAP